MWGVRSALLARKNTLKFVFSVGKTEPFADEHHRKKIDALAIVSHIVMNLQRARHDAQDRPED
jgi:hypothetical protein